MLLRHESALVDDHGDGTSCIRQWSTYAIGNQYHSGVHRSKAVLTDEGGYEWEIANRPPSAAMTHVFIAR
jgi:hypothetical protein